MRHVALGKRDLSLSIYPVRHLCDNVAKLSRHCRIGVVLERYCVAVLSLVANGSALN